jgi:hypothetical protein
MKNTSRKKEGGGSEMLNISRSGAYILKSDEPVWVRLTWVFDFILTGIIYVILGFSISWLVDQVERDFNPSNPGNKTRVFFEAVGELIFSLLFLYILILIIPTYVPDFCLRPPGEHLSWKIYAGGILVTFAIFAAEPKLIEKIKFVFDTKSSNKDGKLDSIVRCFDDSANGTGWTDIVGNVSCTNYR